MPSGSTAGRTAGAVVALKGLAAAKSRLGSLPDPLRRRLAWTMAVDTLRALQAGCPLVVVVSDQATLPSRLARSGLPGVVVVAEERAAQPAVRHGMNAALATGARVLLDHGADVVLACVGDLPALRPASVTAVLSAAALRPRCYLADASGVGTTMLVASGASLDPRFTGRSAAAHHASGAMPLGATELGGPLADARRDVDTEVDLGAAVGLGVGAATAALLDPGSDRLAAYGVVTATNWTDEDGTPLAVTGDGRRVRLPAAALADGLRTARIGQRLHAVLTSAEPQRTVLSAWL